MTTAGDEAPTGIPHRTWIGRHAWSSCKRRTQGDLCDIPGIPPQHGRRQCNLSPFSADACRRDAEERRGGEQLLLFLCFSASLSLCGRFFFYWQASQSERSVVKSGSTPAGSRSPRLRTDEPVRHVAAELRAAGRLPLYHIEERISCVCIDMHENDIAY